MSVLVHDPYFAEMIKRERTRTGADRFDEVWDGVYVANPIPTIDHQRMLMNILKILEDNLWNDAIVIQRWSVSDRDEDWINNYRVPDVSVFLPENPGENRRSHWYGGADFVVEIASPGDRTREKLPFYAKVNTREVLIVDLEDPAIELHRLDESEHKIVGRAIPGSRTKLESSVLPLRFTLKKNRSNVLIEASRLDDDQKWLVKMT
jgi:Uma2 family endonuclease